MHIQTTVPLSGAVVRRLLLTIAVGAGLCAGPAQAASIPGFPGISGAGSQPVVESAPALAVDMPSPALPRPAAPVVAGPTPEAGSGEVTLSDAKPAARSSGRRVALTSPGGFAGPTLADTNAYPPDTQGDVGLTQYIAALNGRIRSYGKETGTADGGIDIGTDAFFASVMTPVGGAVTGNLTGNPRIRYDRLSQRWYLAMVDLPYNVSGGTTTRRANRILLAVSDGPTITASTVWSKSFFWEDLNGGAEGLFAYNLSLGIDQNALYLGANIVSGAGNYAGTRSFVVKKASLLSGGAAVVSGFTLANTSSTGIYTPQGVDDRSGTAAVGWVIGTAAEAFDKMYLYPIVNPGSGSPSIPNGYLMTVPVTARPVNVPHAGNTGGENGKLSAFDTRLYAANMRAGHIWTANTSGVGTTGAASSDASTRDGVRWYDIDVNGDLPALTQAGTVFDSTATNPAHYWIPTVNVNGQGTMAMGGSTAGENLPALTFYTGRKASDAAGTTDTPTPASPTASGYNPPADPGGAGGRAWGSTSFVSVDPEDDQTMWSIQQHTNATNSYGTQITRLRSAAPVVSAVTPAKLTPSPAVSQLTLTGTGIFDPGASFPDRLAVTSDCGATGITITGWTATTVSIDVVAPVAGPCKFTVVNPDGQQSVSPSVTINRAPVAVAGSGTTPRNTVLNGTSVLANDTDADSDPLTAVKQSDPAHGTVALDSGGTYTYTPETDYAGPDAFTYKASDGALSSASATVSITVQATNRAPVATGDAGVTARDTVLQGTSVLVNDTDADGNTLTATKTGDPSHGSVVLSADGTYAYTPATGYAGPDAFTYTATDGEATSNQATVSITVTATNRAPVANDDVAVTPRDVVLNGASVLVNDTDADGNPLTAQQVDDPVHGSVTLASDGTYAYVPAAGYAGPDAFTYRASDGAVTSALATVSITVTATNRPPVAVDDEGTTVHDTVLAGPSLLANDTDPDGNALRAVKTGDPAHGTVAVALDGTYVYTPVAGYSGPDSFTYDADDGALTASATVRLTVLAPPPVTEPPPGPAPGPDPGPTPGNGTPVARGDTGRTLRNVVLRGSSVLANDTDPDGTPLTAVKASDPRHGRLTLGAGGTYVYTPAAGYIGADAFTYRASDGAALSAVTTVAITVTGPRNCRVPRTTGLTVTQAKARLRRAGCTGTVVTRRVTSRTGGRGRVLSSSPAAGRTIAVRTRVTLSVRR